ncbi:MAG: hypothetical protein IPG96_12900 [Proteobacteria bacterium]|nr:hypothetical protein [Pseudomonadota bacterium]
MQRAAVGLPHHDALAFESLARHQRLLGPTQGLLHAGLGAGRGKGSLPELEGHPIELILVHGVDHLGDGLLLAGRGDVVLEALVTRADHPRLRLGGQRANAVERRVEPLAVRVVERAQLDHALALQPRQERAGIGRGAFQPVKAARQRPLGLEAFAAGADQSRHLRHRVRAAQDGQAVLLEQLPLARKQRVGGAGAAHAEIGAELVIGEELMTVDRLAVVVDIGPAPEDPLGLAAASSRGEQQTRAEGPGGGSARGGASAPEADQEKAMRCAQGASLRHDVLHRVRVSGDDTRRHDAPSIPCTKSVSRRHPRPPPRARQTRSGPQATAMAPRRHG